MDVCKDRDTVASRILNVFRHQEEHHNLLRRLTEKEIENEGKPRLVCLFYVTAWGLEFRAVLMTGFVAVFEILESF
jgi:hypothetical protein